MFSMRLRNMTFIFAWHHTSHREGFRPKSVWYVPLLSVPRLPWSPVPSYQSLPVIHRTGQFEQNHSPRAVRAPSGPTRPWGVSLCSVWQIQCGRRQESLQAEGRRIQWNSRYGLATLWGSEVMGNFLWIPSFTIPSCLSFLTHPFTWISGYLNVLYMLIQKSYY